jgi:lipoprotein-anchoring transpeptidase ErfK/SrfK
MPFRPTIVVAALLCALPAGPVLAQILPQIFPPPGYRVAPPPVDPDDDDDVNAAPPGAGRAVPRPYRVAPPPYDPRYPVEQYGQYTPPPYTDPYGPPPRPPAAVEPRPYGSPPGYGSPAYPAYPPQQYPGYPAQQYPGYGTQQGYAAPPGNVPPAARAPAAQGAYASLPPDYRPEEGDAKELPPHLRRQLVEYRTREPAGTLVVDSAHTYLYLVQGNGTAIRYGIGVGREGFTWAGEERISKMAEWPDWYPPADMIERQPYLPRMMTGGPANPLGARALYLGKSLYRIHGTNQPSTIGTYVSSGCIRLTNDDIEDLYGRVQVGTRVVVLAKPTTDGMR